MVTTATASTTVHIFLPVARLAGHVAASTVGFIALGIVALVPVYLVKLLVWLEGPAQLVELFTWLETAVLYVDIGLYGVKWRDHSFVGLRVPGRRGPCVPKRARVVGGFDDSPEKCFPRCVQRRLGGVFSPFAGFWQAARQLRVRHDREEKHARLAGS
jgi:hypothetical protein